MPVGDLPRKTDGANFPIQDLKAMILSIDWEITDAVMGGFLAKVAGLKQEYGEDKLLGYFLQLLWLIGRYIQVHKGQSHPQAIKALQATFIGLEKIAMSPGMPEKEKKKNLALELARYRRLKQTIDQQKRAQKDAETDASTPPAPEAAPNAGVRDHAAALPVIEPTSATVPGHAQNGHPDPQTTTAGEAAMVALEEIKHLIREEFEILRSDLRAWIQTR
jgi:hypothetical protein